MTVQTKNDYRAWRANVALNAYIERIAGVDEPNKINKEVPR